MNHSAEFVTAVDRYFALFGETLLRRDPKDDSSKFGLLPLSKRF